MAIILETLERAKLLEVIKEAPLQVRILVPAPGMAAPSMAAPSMAAPNTTAAAPDTTPDYGERFLAVFDLEGYVLSSKMADFFEEALRHLQEKIWDCDLEATRAWWRKTIESTAEDEGMASERMSAGRSGPAYSRYIPPGSLVLAALPRPHSERRANIGLPENSSGTWGSYGLEFLFLRLFLACRA